jgi:hypothetical protein
MRGLWWGLLGVGLAQWTLALYGLLAWLGGC